jgi:hypothetical protein
MGDSSTEQIRRQPSPDHRNNKPSGKVRYPSAADTPYLLFIEANGVRVTFPAGKSHMVVAELQR